LRRAGRRSGGKPGPVQTEVTPAPEDPELRCTSSACSHRRGRVKTGSTAAPDAAILAKRSGETVKLILSRKDQFQSRAAYKESVLIDIVSAVSPVGKLVARTIDIHQDVGFGTTGVYDVDNVLTRLYQAPMPTRHGVMRGTSYVQSCFAVESHTDAVAEAAGMDPVEFRKANAAEAVFGALLDTCSEMIGHGTRRVRPDHGIGFAICRHGGNQFGAVAAEVSVDRARGTVRVERLAECPHGTSNNTDPGGRAPIWGLHPEEVKLDVTVPSPDLDFY
jgi:CO/xanthine dehydrogenase Mo-binding subunit